MQDSDDIAKSQRHQFRPDPSLEYMAKYTMENGNSAYRQFWNRTDPFKDWLVMLDLDGTVVDSAPVIAGNIRKAVKTVGRPVEEGREILFAYSLDKTLFPGWGRTIEEQVRISEAEFWPLLAGLNNQGEIDGIKLFDKAKKTLFSLYANYRLAAVTSRDTKSATRILNNNGVLGYFDRVLASGERLYRPKPDPEMLCCAIKAQGLRPGSSVMVGDHPTDIEAGKAAGAFTIAVTGGGYSTPEELAAAMPDRMLDYENIDRLPNVVRNIFRHSR
jgi:phosphoglycolate phosphatase